MFDNSFSVKFYTFDGSTPLHLNECFSPIHCTPTTVVVDVVAVLWLPLLLLFDLSFARVDVEVWLLFISKRKLDMVTPKAKFINNKEILF